MYGSSQRENRPLRGKERAEVARDLKSVLGKELRDWRSLAFGLACATILAAVNPATLNEFSFGVRVQILVMLVLFGRLVDYHALPRLLVELANRGLPLFLSLVVTSVISVTMFSLLVTVWLLADARSGNWMISAIFGVVPLMFFYNVMMRHRSQGAFLRPFQSKHLPRLGWYRVHHLPVEKLARRLPIDKRGPILSLRKVGQHVEVHTPRGTTILSGSLSQLIRDTDPDAGLRVHRSTWIRWDQITQLFHRDGNPWIMTRTGEEMPVSRSVVAQIRSYLPTV